MAHYEGLGEGGRDDDEKEEGCVCFREPIQIHVRVINYGSHSFHSEIVG